MRAQTVGAALVMVAVAAVMSPSWAQRPDTSGPQREAMQKLAHWVGEWEGTGWSMRGPGQREEFTVSESVQPKLGGMLFLVQGQKVKTLLHGERAAGVHQVVWDGRDDTGIAVASGVYFYRLESGSFLQSRKMLLLK